MYDHEEFEDDYDGYAERPNKSELKRQAQAQLELGEKLVDLDKASLHMLGLPDELSAAIADAQGIKSRSARKRQLKLIGKILRGMETEALEQWFESREQSRRSSVNAFHEIERWRDRLINGGVETMSEFLSKHPDCDRQHLNQLVRSAVKEISAEKPPKSARLLFKYLKEIM